jgi:hypothetical protein
MLITSKNRQSLFDIAIIHHGAMEAIFSLADRNGLAITDDLSVGQSVEVNNAEVVRRQVVARLAAYGAVPATGITPDQADACPHGGLAYMGVECDFIVS